LLQPQPAPLLLEQQVPQEQPVIPAATVWLAFALLSLPVA
jgi:hypothetical protein